MALEDYITASTFFYIIGAIVIGLIVWYIIRHFQGGRVGEERREERETRRLEQDEKEAEKAQKDEKSNARY